MYISSQYTAVPTYTQFSLCINIILLNAFESIVGLNCYEECSTLHDYGKYETLVIIIIFWLLDLEN